MEAVVIASILNFAVALTVVYFAFRKPATQFLIKRSEGVGAAILEADAECQKAQSALAQWETQWKSSSQQVKEQLQDAEARVNRMREQVLSAAKTEAERLQSDVKLQATSELSKAKAGLCRELAEKSVHLAEKFLEGHLKEEDRRSLVSEYVEKVTNGHAG